MSFTWNRRSALWVLASGAAFAGRLGATSLVRGWAVMDTAAGAKRTNVVQMQPEQDQAGPVTIRPTMLTNPYVVVAESGEYLFPRITDAAVSILAHDGQRYFKPDQDVIIRMPTSDQPLGLGAAARIFGGRHVRVIGGKLTSNRKSNGTFVVSTQSGSAFIEGMHIDANFTETDCFVTRWNQKVADELNIPRTTQPVTTFQNCLATRIEGSTESVIHPDAIQTQGPIEGLFIESFSFEGDFQGIQLSNKPSRGLYMRRCNGRHLRGGDRFLASYDLYDEPGQPHSVYLLDDVWAGDNPPPWDDWQRYALPGPDGKLGRDSISEYMDFTPAPMPAWGKIRRGQPPGGDFVSSDAVGVSYRSPWGMA